MRLWVVHEHAVAQIFGDVAVEAGDHLGAAILICADDLA
jgi:hypothetical protein